MNKIALINGSSKGIGAGIAKYLLQKDFFVYVTYNKGKDKAEEQFSKVKNCKILQLDLTIEDSVKNVFETITNDYGKLDLLVNNASIEIPGRTEDISLDVWKQIFDIRVFGTFLATKYAIPLLKQNKRSTIINISSALPQKGRPLYPAHTAAEAAINSYTKTCAIDLAQYGIRAHTVNPTATRTDMWKTIGGYDDIEMWKKIANDNPLGRTSNPEDIGKAVYLLTTDEAEFLNGNEIFINGGAHIK